VFIFNNDFFRSEGKLELIFNQKIIKKKNFDDRWVKFAFGLQGFLKTENLNLGIVNFKKNSTALNHSHEVEEALCVLSGKAQVRIAGKILNIEKNDFVYIPAHTDHQVITGGKSIKILFIFGGAITITH
jgi:mannose-6-phosphate isomerase-like protein (cupin superfamily)